MTDDDPNDPNQAEKFLRELFEYENCEECGHDERGHTAAIGPFSKLIAICNLR